MQRQVLDGTALRSSAHGRLLRPPYGYAIGVLLWSVFLSVLSLWGVLLGLGLPSLAETVGGLFVGVAGFVVTSLASALVMTLTAWNVPRERIRRQSLLLCLAFVLALLLYSMYLRWPLLPYRHALGMGVFTGFEISKITLLGPAIGFGFVLFPLGVFAYRSLGSSA